MSTVSMSPRMAQAFARASRTRANHLQQQVRMINSAGYLQETVIPTFHFQDSLPKLPVPKLEETLKRYEYFAQPMVSSEEFSDTQKAVQDFLTGAGPDLQKRLEARDASRYSSFISEPWFDMYLESRDALMINVNPVLKFKDDPKKTDQAVRAGSLIHSSIAFYRTLRDGKLKPDIFHTQPKKSETPTFENLIKLVPRKFSFYGAYSVGAYPLDMSQYDRLFSSTRVPRSGKDELVKYPESQSRHIVVQYGSDFFPVDVLNEDGTSKSREFIEGSLKAILSKPARWENGESLGALTSMNRESWANAREEIVKSSLNQKSMEMIDSAMFAVCLDEATPSGEVENVRTLLHGDGSNRWFDKSFQLIVCANGSSAINFEHAWGDGVAVLRYFNEVYKDSTSAGLVEADPSVPRPEPAKFELSDSTKDTVKTALAEAKSFIAAVEFKTLVSDAVSKSFFKDMKLGGDGFLQMSYQLAHEKMHHYTPATYESASTSAFKHGRTETIRSATPEAAEFAKAFVNPDASLELKGAALRKAVARHGEITKDALTGKGVDRHLFALRDIAARAGEPTPAIFEDKAYQVLNKIILSTSTLASDALDAGAFGPVNQDCYGIGYGMREEGAGFIVSSYHKGTDEFLKHLDDSLREMRDVAEKTK